MKKALMILTLCFLSAGCATVGHEMKAETVTQIKEGVTTDAEVKAILGEPYMKTLGSDGKTMWTYQYTKVKNRATNFIPVVGLFNNGLDMRQQMVQVLIGKDGKVEKYTMNDSNTPINSGLLNTR